MGKGGGALSGWLREFFALVFTQTIQAFIYAIVISIIMFGMTRTTSVDGNDANAALGLMSVFALLSVFKVEDITKKIFGIPDSKASPANAMRSVAKTAFALKLGKRVLDNVGKVTGGIGKMAKGGQDRRKQMKRLQEDMEDNGFKMGEDGKPVYVGKNGKTTSGTAGATSPNKMSDAQKKYYDKALEAKANGDTDGYKKYMEQAAFARTLEKSSGSSSGGTGADVSADVTISDAAKRRMKNALRNYEDKLDEIKKSQREGAYDILKGVTESAGGLVGGTMGGILGGADGNLDEMFQGMVGGAGLGDAVGESMVKALEKGVNFAQRNYKRGKDGWVGVSHKKLKGTIDAYNKVIADATTSWKDSSVDDAND